MRKILLLLSLLFFLSAFFFLYQNSLSSRWIEECSTSQVEEIARNIELGIANTYMFGTSSDYSLYVDETLLDVYIRGKQTHSDVNRSNERFYAVTEVNVQQVEIEMCLPKKITFRARIEVANEVQNRNSGEVLVPCYGTATEGPFTIVHQEGVWKYSKSATFRQLIYPSIVDTATSVEDLRRSVCS